MADPPNSRKTDPRGGRADLEPDTSGADGGLPRWVKIVGIIAIVVVLLMVVMLLVGGGHGPGRHALSLGGY
jgi:hypothetical protein